MIIAALAMIATTDRDRACFMLADVAESVIEAHEANVPIQQAMSIVDGLVDAPPLANIARNLIIKIYRTEPTGEPVDRVQTINELAANCMKADYDE